MTDFRALCAELADWIHDETRTSSGIPHPLVARARALLAQPEPQGLPPRVGHILRLAEIIREVDGNYDKGAAALAEAILSHPESRWQLRSDAQPEPEGPTDEEILALSQEHGVSYTRLNGGVIYPRPDGYDMRGDVLSFARDVLARWGRPAIKPVP